MGPIGFLGSPLETFRAIKQEVVAKAKAPLPLVMGITNDTLGYAPDRETAAKATGYAAGFVPLMGGTVPFADVHGELVRELLPSTPVSGRILSECPATPAPTTRYDLRVISRVRNPLSKKQAADLCSRAILCPEELPALRTAERKRP